MPRRTDKKREKKDKREKRRLVTRKKSCRFCVDKDLKIDYKLARQLGQFLSERGKIIPRRNTGNCAFHQRKVVESIERARVLAFLPYTIMHTDI